MKLKTYIYRLYKKLKTKLSYERFVVDRDILRDLAQTKTNLGEPVSTSETPSKYFLIMSFSNLPFLIKVHCLMGLLLRKEGFEPILLTYSGCRWSEPYAALFGIKEVIYWDQLQGSLSDEDLKHVQETVDDFMTVPPKIQDLKNWEYKGVACGKQALSTMIRKELKGQLDLESPEVQKVLKEYLFSAVKSVLVAHQLLDRFNIRKLLVRDSGYLPNGAIFETALNNSIDAIRFEMAQMKGTWQVKRYSPTSKRQALFSISPETWTEIKDVSLDSSQERLLDEDFQERYNPDSVHDMYNYQKDKREMNQEEVQQHLGLDTSKPTAVVFSHISWDANFFDGEDLFDDFEHWLVETVSIASDNPNLNWIIKLHPANVYKLVQSKGTAVRETELDALQKLGSIPAHIKIIRASDPINTWSLIKLMDVGLTVRGTIGMELPCFGIPVVIAGTGRYDNYGFTIEPKSRAAYKDTLMSLHQNLNMSQQSIDLAKRHAYWVFLKRTVSFDEVAEMTTNLKNPTHPLHHNFIIKPNFLDLVDRSEEIKKFIEWFAHSRKADVLS